VCEQIAGVAGAQDDSHASGARTDPREDVTAYSILNVDGAYSINAPTISDTLMIKRALLLIAMVGVYAWMRRRRRDDMATKKDDRAAEAEWANEGGRIPPPPDRF
jgi:hypothetical protein